MIDFNATDFGLFLSTSTLLSTQSLVTTSFDEHQTKISTLWLGKCAHSHLI